MNSNNKTSTQDYYTWFKTMEKVLPVSKGTDKITLSLNGDIIKLPSENAKLKDQGEHYNCNDEEYPINSTENLEKEDEWMDEVLDNYIPIKLPIPKKITRTFIQPLICSKCNKTYKKICYNCQAQVTLKQKIKVKNLCGVIVKQQYRPTFVKLGFQETVNSLRKKMQKILNIQKLKGNNVDVYWRVGTKQSNDLNWIARQVMDGELAVACYRLKGGMNEDSDDEIPPYDTVNNKLMQHDWKAFKKLSASQSLYSGPFELDLEKEDVLESNTLNIHEKEEFVLKTKAPFPGNLKKQQLPYQQPAITMMNDLVIVGSRNRENRTPKAVPDHKKNAKAKINNTIKTGKANYVSDTPKDVTVVGHNGDFYLASVGLYETDPGWKLSKLSSKFEDQLQYARYSLTNNLNQVVCLNPTVGNLAIPKPIPKQINILTQWSNQIQYIWLPTPKEYDRDFDYACRLVGDNIEYSFPFCGSYITSVYPNSLRPTGESYLIFNQYVLDEQSDLFEPKSLSIKIPRRNQPTLEVCVPEFVLTYAKNWMGGKNLTNFTIVSYLNEATKWYNNTANREFEKPSSNELIAALFQASREKQVALFDILGLNFDILNLQNDNTRLLVDLPKYGNVWSLLKKIASWIVPNELLDVAKEAMDNYKYTGTGLKIWSQIRHAFDSGVIFLFGKFMPNLSMKAFTWMNDKASVIVEELLKLIPGLGLVISVKEAIDDWKKGKLTVTGALGRIVFHNWHEILPFWAKLLTLPIRMAWHYVWNKSAKESKTILETMKDMTYDRREPPITEFTVTNHESTFPRFPKSEHVDIPESIPDKRFINTMLEDVTEDPRNPVFVCCTVASSNVAGVKNGNNLVSAYLKRNIQDRPIKALKSNHVKRMYQISNFWKEKLDLKEVNTWDWINAKNHGSKKVMYTKAYQTFLLTGDIDYKATLNLKFDEIIMKNMMRTICAFDNSYVVNVAPTIASCSNALKKLFNGYNNLSKSGKYTLHILYATGMTSDEICKVIDDNNIESSTPHYFLMVLGDDSALIRDTKVLCCDFSRYDSTQHDDHHEVFRRTFTTPWNYDKIEMLRKAATAPTQMFDPNSGNKYIVQTVGLKTGCMETSVSNTYITALSYALGLHIATIEGKDPLLYIPEFLEKDCGFLPKANIQDLNTGFEFLKTIFILQQDRIVSLPLLSCMAKLGKFLKKPSLIVPFSKLKNDHQIAVDAIMMQLKGKGNLHNIPGFVKWYNKVDSMSQPFLPELTLLSHQLKLTGFPVHKDTIATAYESRYGLDWQSVEFFFEMLADLELEDYPVTYTSTVVQRAIEVDYGLDPLC